MGMDPKDSVKIPEDYGGGYLATPGMPHQLHCLVSVFSTDIKHIDISNSCSEYKLTQLLL